MMMVIIRPSSNSDSENNVLLAIQPLVKIHHSNPTLDLVDLFGRFYLIPKTVLIYFSWMEWSLKWFVKIFLLKLLRFLKEKSFSIFLGSSSIDTTEVIHKHRRFHCGYSSTESIYIFCICRRHCGPWSWYFFCRSSPMHKKSIFKIDASLWETEYFILLRTEKPNKFLFP